VAVKTTTARAVALAAFVTLCSNAPAIAEDKVSAFPTPVAAIDTEVLTYVSIPVQVAEMPTIVRTIPEIIDAAAEEFGQDAARMRAVAYCESTFRPAVIDGTVRGDSGLAVGLFQFHPDTWSEESRFLGYTGDLRADPVASSRVAAFMWSKGLQRRWSCYR
jgi:hypothetical protein